MVDPPKVAANPSTNRARRSLTVDVTNAIAMHYAKPATWSQLYFS